MNLVCGWFCQGAFGLGGQDWVSDTVVVAGSYEVTRPEGLRMGSRSFCG